LPPPEERVEFTGVGSAHGLGMAMDGVEGQARAGWSHERILSLFYPGTYAGRAYGTIRVGIADGATQRVTLPAGGTVTNASPGSRATNGFPVRLTPGGSVVVTPVSGRLAVRVTELPVAAKPTAKAKATPKPTARAKLAGAGGVVVPTPPPIPTPTPKPVHPTPTPAPTSTAFPGGVESLLASGSVWVVPSGTPALTSVDAAGGHRYRGLIQFRPSVAGVRVVNHVSLDDYLSGIAEEKGQGWPDEAMKALAVAARTLGVATMTWLDTHHTDGYDICPTGECQLYLGYDYEEPSMRSAALETSGEIRMYGSRAIMAMYHGNGGGQTESYKALSNSTDDSYPYLRSIKYPYADPWHWHIVTSLTAIEDAFTKDKTGIPSPLKYVVVLKRGESPRVTRVGLFGSGTKGVALNGFAFSRSLGLPSAWFYVHLPHKPPRSIKAAFLNNIDNGEAGPTPTSAHLAWPLVLLAGALAAAAAAGNWAATGGGGALMAWKRRRRDARASSPREASTRARRSRARVAGTPAADASATG
jgi:SpoIID/LytB domain protein